ncbi:HAD-IC family P-type ATPase [Peterkaempfera bronchialis]|uniref:HAD family hydrolase n=1 Tax=Peterkaempfera bronchialis TaxID=2126346 RepID=A0A345SSP1_9ACTN|nr:HAD-IC family P-type ATPase [Peterkaempfera bronchialis]AXI76746.1 HAD family hydrolase [Peterkaempfera bronchialis]
MARLPALLAAVAVAPARPALTGLRAAAGGAADAIALVRSGTAAAASLTRTAAAGAVDVATRPLPALLRLPETEAVGRALRALVEGDSRRRIWSAGGRAHIQIRGLAAGGPRLHRLASAVTTALQGIKGVHLAEVNAVTGHVLVAFAEDQVDVAELVEAVRSAEEAFQHRGGAGAAGTAEAGGVEGAGEIHRPLPPDDEAATAAASVALVLDCAGLVGASLARLTRIAPAPRVVRAAVALADSLPAVRQDLGARVGRHRAEVLLAAVNAALHGISDGVAPLAVDAAHRCLQLYEVRARGAAWSAAEPRLCAGGVPTPHRLPELPPRSVPFPQGPVERASDRTALAEILGAGAAVLVSHHTDGAADAMLATVPRAARLGRESFAAVLGHDLAVHGTVVLDPLALRRLDRIDAVVMDARVLCGETVRLLSAEAVQDGLDDAEVWQAAARVLHGRTASELDGPGPWRRGRYRLQRGGGDGGSGGGGGGGGAAGPQGLVAELYGPQGLCGRVRVGVVAAPLAEAVIDAAQQNAAQVAVTAHASIHELLGQAEEAPGGDEGLTEAVRGLQTDGRAVLLVARGCPQALLAADVGVSVCPEGGGTDWTADIVCGAGGAEGSALEQAWRVLTALAAAREQSAAAAHASVAASALGGLLSASRPPEHGRGPLIGWRTAPPVHLAALGAMVTGALRARGVARRSAPPPVVRDAWHALPGDEVYRRMRELRVGEGELTAGGGGEGGVGGEGGEGGVGGGRWWGGRRWRGGVAAAARVPGVRGAADLYRATRDELHDPLTPVLTLGAAASAVVGSGVDAVLVGGVMLGNAVISGAQRMRAERALHALLLRQRTHARLVEPPPEGTAPKVHDPAGVASRTVPAERLRPGDLIAVHPEDVVPADVRLLTATSLEVDEASLTGEPLPVGKTPEAVPNSGPAERTCMLYEGTVVLAGSGVGVVVATGPATEAGRAARAAGRVRSTAGLQARLAELTSIALPATGVGGLAVTGLGLLRGLKLPKALASGVAVAVAAVPEGLPLVATVAQLAAARRLSGLGVLVRSTRALEALGRVDTVCFDKTGTLTEGRLSLVRTAALHGPVPIGGGTGRQILRTAARACPPFQDGTRGLAHATDRAVAEAALDHEVAPDWTLLGELPFETGRGFSAAIGSLGDGRLAIAVKGAPETVLERCVEVLDRGGRAVPLTEVRRQRARERVRALAGRGLRVLAVARVEGAGVEGAGVGVEGEELVERVRGACLLGFVGIADTPRPAAPASVAGLVRAGVRPVMVTGDHPVTAAAVAADIGIPFADRVLTGAELEELPPQRRAEAVCAAGVFARVSPTQKVRIVRELQRAGRVVAMTGDGTNDAAAIRRADVGIAVAGRGSGSARSAADLVLTAPDPRLILDALAEGRSLWASVRDAVAILVGGNAGEIAFTLVGTAVSGRAPLSTRQLLVVNMLTDMLPALAVALTPRGAGEEDGEEDGGGPVQGFTGPEVGRVLAVRGSATAAAALVAWQVGRVSRVLPRGGRRASTMGLAALVGAQLGQTLIGRWRSPLVLATCAVSAAALVAAVEVPGVNRFFGNTALGPLGWGVVVGCAVVATVGAALGGRVLRRG